MQNPEFQHPWDVTPEEAIAIQNRLRGFVTATDDLGEVHLVAGVDIGFEDNWMVTRAAVVVLNLSDLTVYEHAVSRRPTSFPYIPGLLSFREIPAAMEALAQLTTPPDLLLVDGQGRIHPRRFGIACHLGLLTGLPAVGVGKSPFVGTHAAVPNQRGAWEPVLDDGEVIGAALRSRVNTKPLYISSGHRISLETALDYVMRCTPQYRLPRNNPELAHKTGRRRRYSKK
ncbi:MAG: deoxyribonuclease V [Blastochloris sp.]|nr:deoxyribonuclease V [Blastochloris sp.]